MRKSIVFMLLLIGIPIWATIPPIVIHHAVPYAEASYLATVIGWKCSYTQGGNLATITFEREGDKRTISPIPSMSTLDIPMTAIITLDGKPYLPVIEAAKGLNAVTRWDIANLTLTLYANPMAPSSTIRVDQLSIDCRLQIYKYRYGDANDKIKYPESSKEGSKEYEYKISQMHNSWIPITPDSSLWQGSHIALLVHGFPLQTEGVCRADLLKLAAHLSNDIYDDSNKAFLRYDAVYAVEYPLNSHIDETGAAVAQIIASHCSPGMRIDIFAHSMGGLVARSAIEGPFPINRPTAEKYVAHLVTLGSPHKGHPWAGDGNNPWLIKKFQPALAQAEFYDEVLDMEMGKPVSDGSRYSEFLQNLNNRHKTLVRYYSIYGNDPSSPYPYQGMRVKMAVVDYSVQLNPSQLKGLTFREQYSWSINDGFMPVPSADMNLSDECQAWKDSPVAVHHDALLFDPSVFRILDRWIIDDAWLNQVSKLTNPSPIFVIDRSGSMTQVKGVMGQVQQDAEKFVESILKHSAKAAVINFSGPGTCYLDADFTNNRETLLKAIRNPSVADGGTALYDALITAINKARQNQQNPIIILLTDGGENSSHETLEKAIAIANSGRRSVPVIAVGYEAMEGRNEKDLRKLASMTGGFYTNNEALDVESLLGRAVQFRESKTISTTRGNPE
ncbi:MAG: VWA domain-containing protein [Armatimonadota bacterium]